MWSAVILPSVVPQAWQVWLSRLIVAALTRFQSAVLYLNCLLIVGVF
jgi:hypothetical protein